MPLSVVMDGRPLQAGFKAHAERGIGRYSRNLIKAMLELEGGPDLELLVQDNLPRQGLPAGVPQLAAGYMPMWLPRFKRLASHYWLARRPLLEPWRRGKVVHFLCHLDAPLRPGPRTVVTVHDLIAQRLERLYKVRVSGLRFKVERWLETRILYTAARIIAVSRQTKTDLVELYGIDPARITVVYEATDPGLAPEEDPRRRQEVLARHGLADGEPFFLYLGGIDQRKGLEFLLQALAELKRRRLPHRLALAGRIEQDKQYPLLLKEIKALGLEQSVRLLGFVPDDELPALFGSCLAFVFPSLYEGFGLPPLEAMTCGAPVVAARAAAVPEVVGEAGILVEPGDAGVLTEALAGLALNPELARDLRQKGFARAREFSWRRAAQETLEIYGEVAHET